MDRETELLARIQHGDEAALAELYDRLSPKVYTLVLRILDHQQEAEEVVQDTFYRLFKLRRGYHTWDRSPRAFVYTLARNVALSRVRARRSRPAKADAWDVHDPEVPLPAETEGTEATTKIWLGRALARLNPEERGLLEHAYFLGYSYADLAELRAKPLGTVRSSIRRALLKLKKAMSDEAS